MTKLTHVPATISSEDIVEILSSEAGLVIDNILSQDTLSTIQQELSPYLAAAAPGRNEFAGHQTKRLGALMARSPACRELALNPLINGACSKFLGPYCNGYQLHFTQAVSIGPNEGAQMLHRDRGVWGGYMSRAIETQFSTIWAMTDFTEDNGATRIVPGSHLWDKDRDPQAHEIIPAEMKAGSVLIYSGSVIHGGGANQTDNNRLGVLLHYTLNWLRQEENQYLSCPPEIARTLSPELRALMGYSMGGPVLGFYSSPELASKELAPPENLFNDRPGPLGKIDSSNELLEKTRVG